MGQAKGSPTGTSRETRQYNGIRAQEPGDTGRGKGSGRRFVALFSLDARAESRDNGQIIGELGNSPGF